MVVNTMWHQERTLTKSWEMICRKQLLLNKFFNKENMNFNVYLVSTPRIAPTGGTIVKVQSTPFATTPCV
jgi:hypothetical protein